LRDYGGISNEVSTSEQPDRDPLAILKAKKAMKSKLHFLTHIFNHYALIVRITWTYGGKEVFIVGSFTNWDYMIKMNKNIIGVTPVFEISMVRLFWDYNFAFQYVKEGSYYYYFVVDGKVRFAPDQPSTIDKKQKIVNFIEIDRYMIERAESARDPSKVKSMIDCVASENSWRLSENFERNCKERGEFNIDEDVHISMEMHTDSDPCYECEISTKDNKVECNTTTGKATKLTKKQQTEKAETTSPQKHHHFYPSSTFVDKDQIKAKLFQGLSPNSFLQ
jgi:hypothetical protein